jgi:thiamine pyrophosphokinase
VATRRPDPTGSPVAEVVVLAGGDAVPLHLAGHLPRDAVVIAADSGLSVATRLGLQVDLIVGDLDSVDPGELAAAESDGIAVDRHPLDKDRTDLAIALDTALRYRPTRVTVLGGHGGRLDHLIANALLFAAEAYAEVEIVALMGAARVTVVRHRAELVGRPGELVSLLPVHGPALAVTTTGLRFALDGEELHAGSSRGVSNEFVATSAQVRLDAGVLLAVQPGELAPTRD